MAILRAEINIEVVCIHCGEKLSYIVEDRKEPKKISVYLCDHCVEATAFNKSKGE